MRILGSRLRIRPIKTVEERTAGGLILLQTRKINKIACDVLEVGNKVEMVKTGDKIYIEPGSGTPFDDITLIIAEHEIRSIFDPADDKLQPQDVCTK